MPVPKVHDYLYDTLLEAAHVSHTLLVLYYYARLNLTSCTRKEVVTHAVRMCRIHYASSVLARISFDTHQDVCVLV